MPASPAAVRCGQTSCYELVGYWSTAYRLTSQRRTLEDGHSTTALRYEFLGYELLETRAEGESLRQNARWLVGLRNWFSMLPRRFAKWMVDPIDYPLKLRIDEATLSQRG